MSIQVFNIISETNKLNNIYKYPQGKYLSKSFGIKSGQKINGFVAW